jgi:hypothetical protein
MATEKDAGQSGGHKDMSLLNDTLANLKILNFNVQESEYKKTEIGRASCRERVS